MTDKQSATIRNELEEFLGEKFQKLSSLKQHELLEIYKKKRKTDIIYIWWFLNFHYAYIRRWWLCVLFLLTFGGIGVWWLIDLFRLSTILSIYNKKKAEELFEKLG